MAQGDASLGLSEGFSKLHEIETVTFGQLLKHFLKKRPRLSLLRLLLETLYETIAIKIPSDHTRSTCQIIQ